MATAMQRIQDLIMSATINGKPKVALDTCCVQYYINEKQEQPWADCLDPIFRAGLAGKIDLYVSQIVVSELLAKVHYDNRHNVGFDPELNLLAIMNRHFQILDVNEEIARSAGRLRGNYIPGDRITLKTPDALIGATSIVEEHTLFVTNDGQLKNALPEANCLYLSDVALEWLAEKFPSTCCLSDEPVIPMRTGKGLTRDLASESLELGSIKPDQSASWKHILKDAFIVASTVNESCMFFVLASQLGRRKVTQEVLFWHEGLAKNRPPNRIMKRLQEHLGYSTRTHVVTNKKNSVYIFCFTSLSRERARNSQPCFESKNNHQREADSWRGYLSQIRIFENALRLPQTYWLLCESSKARFLNLDATKLFLSQAKNVLGWENEK
jgi:predicted nucleic acid-binding protein